MMRLFAFLQAALLAAAAATSVTAQEQRILECTPALVQDYDFTMDGRIGKVEFIQLLEELAPPTCDVVSLWQSGSNFQSALQDLSCLCTEFGGTKDTNCCDGSSPAEFSVPGVYDEAYDHAVCEHIEQVVRVECFSEDDEETQASPAVASPSNPPTFSNLRASETETRTTATASILETSTANLSVAMLSIAAILSLCVFPLLRILSTSVDTEVAQGRHQELLAQEKQLFDTSREVTSTTPYVQIV